MGQIYQVIIRNILDKQSKMGQSKTLFWGIVVLVMVGLSRCQIQNCQNPQYIIPYDPIDSAFDVSIDSIRGKNEIITLIQNPTPDNGKNYLLSLAPFSAPLFAMAGVTLAIFIATIVQVICFNSCSKDCCGNEINGSTYNVCCFRTMVVSFLVLCFLTLAISIAALIVNSDLQKAIDYTQCNTENIVYETYNGNTNTSINWSGVNNFQKSISAFSVNIQNNVPFLVTYFSSAPYTQITSTSTGSSYANSQIFSCANSATTINCPFPSSVQNCSTTYLAQFNQQFCNASFVNSAAYLVQNQMTNNSTTWLNNTKDIASYLGTLNTNSQSVQDLVNSISTFTTSVGSYQTSIQNGFNSLDSVQNSVSIAFYVFYSFTLALSLLGMTAVCMIYFCNVFKCRYIMYFFWYAFFLVSLLLWIDSGFFLGGSVGFQDSCLAYKYFFQTNVSNFNQLNFSTNPELGNTFKTCFYSQNANSKSIFTGFSNTSILAQFGNLYSMYTKAVPSSQFSSVVTSIQNTLINYAVNPNTVTIQNVPTSMQPQTALNQMNQFANASLSGTTQSCKLTKDYFTYDVINCGLFLTNQAVGSNSCVVLYDTNINTFVNNRVTSFNNKGCATDGNTYQARVNALISYGNSITSIVAALAPVSQASTPLQNYQNNYYNYYSNVLNFYNVDVQQIFNGFFNPYNTLQAGSNCGFVSTSMNGITNVACNQLQPYVGLFSALNIVQSIFLFVLFLLSYFLTVRFQFYEFLEGNFANYGVKTVTINALEKNYEMDSTGRNIQLLTANNSQL